MSPLRNKINPCSNIIKLLRTMVSVSPAQIRELERTLVVAWNQMQFLRSPLLHQLDKVVLNAKYTTINFKRESRKTKKQMSKLMHATDKNYSDLQVPSEILHEILTFSNDYYDHILLMHNELSIYQYFTPQMLNLIELALIATLLLLPPNCVFFSILFNVCNMKNTDILQEKYNLFDLETMNEYEFICTDHELLGFMLCVTTLLHFMGIFAALFLNYNGKYTQKWMAIKNILSTLYDREWLSTSYPFELLYPFQKWCCIDHNYYLLPHSNFANMELLRNSIHSMFWQFVNPLCLYVAYCLFKPLLSFMLSIYYWQIYRFSMRYNSDTNFENIQIPLFFMLCWFFGIFFLRDVLRIIVDGWIGSRISCLVIAEVYLQIYCNDGDNTRFEALNMMIWIMAASIYKLVEYLVVNLYFKSYVPCNHRAKHSIQQFIYDWYSMFFIFLMYVYGFGWLFIANNGEVFMLSQSINSVVRLIIGCLIYIDAQLDIVIFDEKLQNMSNMQVIKQILFCREYKLMNDWRKMLK